MISLDQKWDQDVARLKAISDPQAKLQMFAEMTDEALNSVSFQVLTELANDKSITAPLTTLGWTSVAMVENIEKTIVKCLKLSDEQIKPLPYSAKCNWSKCNTPDTYIHYKIAQVLNKFLGKRLFFISPLRNTLLKDLNDTMDKLSYHSHGKTCPCYQKV